MTDTILDFKKKREENIEQKRRSFERVVFKNFLGAYSVIDDNGSLLPIELVDISKSGCLFQIPCISKADKKFDDGFEISLRMYFSEKSFIPAVCKIMYNKEFTDTNGNTFLQYGCEFDKSYPSFSAVQKFIEFMYSFAEHSSIDKGDRKVYFL